MEKLKTIKINHIAKMEGHTGFVAHILDNDVKSAKLETLEGSRLIEGILIGRDYFEAPMITGRICGICPVVHFLSSCQAIEAAMGVKVSEQTIKFRKIMELLQIIHSHTLHLYFLTLPDFHNIENDLNFIKKFPKEAGAAIRIRQFAINLVELIGGRVVHPLTMTIGGFKKLPSKEQINNLLKDYSQVLKDAQLIVNFVLKIKFPQFERVTEFISLYDKKDYAVYQGNLINQFKTAYTKANFYKELKEEYLNKEKVIRAKFKGEPYMLGAIARVNNNFTQLNSLAKKCWKKSRIDIPTYNPFHNVIAQAVEVVHCLEEVKKLFNSIKQVDQQNTLVSYKIKAGQGIGVVEAPRGILVDYFKVDSKGKIIDCNIMTPTAQFLNNLEADLAAYLPNVLKLSEKERTRKIRALIRAYDPCISCATH